MTDDTQPVQLAPDSRADRIFPTLTPAQVARIAAHRRVRRVTLGGAAGRSGLL